MSLTRNDNLKEKNDSLDYLNDFQFPEQTKFSDLEDLIDQFFHSNIENSKSNELNQENSKTQVAFLDRAAENYGNDGTFTYSCKQVVLKTQFIKRSTNKA